MINILTPNQLDQIPQPFEELFQDLETFIIQDFSRRLKKTGKITSTAEWQRQQAKLFGIKNIEAKIASIMNLSNDQIETLFPDIALVSLNAEMEIYKAAKLNTIDYKSKAIQDYVKVAIKATKDDIENLTQSMGFAEVQNGKVVYSNIAKFYQKELNMAHAKVMTGTQDYNSAIKQATKKLSESGLRRINYESGRSVEAYAAARTSVLTGVHQMTEQMSIDTMNKIIPNKDDQYVEVTSHFPCRPSHLNFQGRVFKVVGSDKDYPNLAESTGLGTPGGLKGVNCRHDYYTFIPDISVRAYTDAELKDMEKKSKEKITYKDTEYTPYEATQYQREIERNIRETKRQLIAYKETGLDEEFKISSARLNSLNKEYKDFSSASDIRPKNERTQQVGFDRSISQKANAEGKKYAKQIAENE